MYVHVHFSTSFSAKTKDFCRLSGLGSSNAVLAENPYLIKGASFQQAYVCGTSTIKEQLTLLDCILHNTYKHAGLVFLIKEVHVERVSVALITPALSDEQASTLSHDGHTYSVPKIVSHC